MSEMMDGIKIPTTAGDWELYSTMPGVGKAARAMTTAIKKAIREFKARIGQKDVPHLLGDVYEKHVSPVMSKYSSFGAWDTEPRYHAKQTLADAAKLMVFGTTEGYHPEFVDLI
jgi:hypothetical protein